MADLAALLARLTPRFTGADIAFVTHRAVMLYVKEAAAGETTSTAPAIRVSHFEAAVLQMRDSGGVTRVETNGLVTAPFRDRERELDRVREA